MSADANRICFYCCKESSIQKGGHEDVKETSLITYID